MSLSAALVLLTTVSSLRHLEPIGSDGVAITIQPTEVRYVETKWSETVLRGRPWVPFRRLATLGKGARLLVRGVVESRDKGGCEGKPWYAVHPFGFICSTHVKPAQDPPSSGRALPLAEGRTLPHDYVVVREEKTPTYASEAEIAAATPRGLLTAGMSLAVGRSREVAGVAYIETVDGMLVPKDSLGWMGKGSQWSGVAIAGEPAPGPAFAWVRRDKTPVYASRSTEATPLDHLPRRRRIALAGPAVTEGDRRWWPIADDRWVESSRINAVSFIPPPADVLGPGLRERGNDQWIDVDLGEQVLVAYRGERPVFATMISSGRASPTPRGNYPIWAKVASMTMGNQGYEDNPYRVEHVPWVLLFQGHNALHGAYWHDRFGERRSHGCVNLAPKDARWIFEWTSPSLPEGWTGYLPGDLERSVTVHVRDSSLPPAEAFIQERPLGPPDREEERRKLEEAEARRAKQRSAAEAAAAAEAAEAAVRAHAPDPDAPTLPGPHAIPQEVADEDPLG